MTDKFLIRIQALKDQADAAAANGDIEAQKESIRRMELLRQTQNRNPEGDAHKLDEVVSDILKKTTKEEIEDITSEDIKFYKCGKGTLEQLENLGAINVYEQECRVSRNHLVSRDFLNCNGIFLVDEESKLGGLAHYSRGSLYYMLKDKLIGDGLTDDSVRLFANRERIIPVHVYNETGQIRTELSIDEVLQGMGFQKPIHIPVKSKPGAEVPEPTHLAYAVQTGTIYIFPQEFDFGICTTIKELKDKK